MVGIGEVTSVEEDAGLHAD